jgi:glutathione S-transferase
MTRLYHVPGTRSDRIVWALEEIGEPYELTLMTPEQRRSPEHLGRHALGRVPVIEDEAGTLFESAAIVLALADRHPQAGLSFPLASRERDLVYQWVLFAMADWEPAIGELRRGRQEELAVLPAVIERAIASTVFVEQALDGREFIVGGRFSAADIVLGSVAANARRIELPGDFPRVAAYVEALHSRPAYLRSRADR